MSDARALVVIPARWGSTRLPGKPLVMIAGHTLLERVVHVARLGVRWLDHVQIVVATDDDRVAVEAARLDCGAVLTDAGLTSGTSRTLAAAMKVGGAIEHVVNLQGDAPFLPPSTLTAVLDALAAGARVATPVVRLDWHDLDRLREHKQLAPFSGTTAIVAPNGRARWFSKQIIPAIRSEDRLRRSSTMSPILRHVGVYGYAIEALRRFEALAPDPMEVLEELEQLRFIGADIPIATVEVGASPITMNGIDTPADVELAEQLLAKHGDPLR